MKTSMKTILAASVIFWTLSSDANASSRGFRHISPNGEFSFQVETYGSALPIYYYQGKSYLEGNYGNSYAIRVFNHTGERVEAVVTVDGRDVISGQIGNWRSNRGYVIEAYDSVLIEGFRSSWSNVASFVFTDVGDSYAARMGDASNVGVIGVAVFKERVYRPAPPPPIYQNERPKKKAEQNLGTKYGRSEGAAGPSASRSAPSTSYEMYDRGQGIGTGYGSNTYSPSTSAYFTRRASRPDSLLSLHYDDRQGLISKGVLPAPVPYRYRPSKPEPFPQSPSFAPPPPPRWWE